LIYIKFVLAPCSITARRRNQQLKKDDLAHAQKIIRELRHRPVYLFADFKLSTIFA
jgi:hypothetical protein